MANFKTGAPMRYCLNLADGVVHDLETHKDECKISNIVANGTGVGYCKFQVALSAGFVACPYCMSHVETDKSSVR